MTGGKGLPHMSDIQRAQIIHIDVDRRLGHEWDEWDGNPLPNSGNYDSSPTLFFRWSAASIATSARMIRRTARPFVQCRAGSFSAVEP